MKPAPDFVQINIYAYMYNTIEKIFTKEKRETYIQQ